MWRAWTAINLTLLLSAASVPTATEEARSAIAVGDLPLIEVPAPAPGEPILAIIVSGDGGWAGLVQKLSHALNERGIPVVGLNSLRYFWNRRTPEEAAAALERVAQRYLGEWKKEKLLLVGYSLGADVLPFMVSRLSDDMRRRIHAVALLGPGATVDFKFHVSEWFGGGHSPSERAVLPEVEKLIDLRVLCIYGEEEKDSICPLLAPTLAQKVMLKGAHHFGGDSEAVSDALLDGTGLGSARTVPQ